MEPVLCFLFTVCCFEKVAVAFIEHCFALFPAKWSLLTFTDHSSWIMFTFRMI